MVFCGRSVLFDGSCGNTLEASARLLLHITWPSPPDRPQRNSPAASASSRRRTAACSHSGRHRSRRGGLSGGKSSWPCRTQPVRWLVVRPTVRRRPEHGKIRHSHHLPVSMATAPAARYLSLRVLASVRQLLGRTWLMFLSALQNASLSCCTSCLRTLRTGCFVQGRPEKNLVSDC